MQSHSAHVTSIKCLLVMSANNPPPPILIESLLDATPIPCLVHATPRLRWETNLLEHEAGRNRAVPGRLDIIIFILQSNGKGTEKGVAGSSRVYDSLRHGLVVERWQPDRLTPVRPDQAPVFRSSDHDTACPRWTYAGDTGTGLQEYRSLALYHLTIEESTHSFIFGEETGELFVVGGEDSHVPAGPDMLLPCGRQTGFRLRFPDNDAGRGGLFILLHTQDLRGTLLGCAEDFKRPGLLEGRVP